MVGKWLTLWYWTDFSWKEGSVLTQKKCRNNRVEGFFCFLKIAILFFQPSVPFAADGRGDGAGWGESFGFGTSIAFTVYKTREDICPQWSITHGSRILAPRSCPALSLQMHTVEMVMHNPVLPPPCCPPCLHSVTAPFAHGLLLSPRSLSAFPPQRSPSGLTPFLFQHPDAAGGST